MNFERPKAEKAPSPEAEAVLVRHEAWYGEALEHLKENVWSGRFGPEDADGLDWTDAELMRELSRALDEWLKKETTNSH